MAEITESNMTKPGIAEPGTEVSKDTVSEETKNSQTVPYSRFKEIVAEKNSAVERISELESRLQAQLAMTQDLQARYTQSEDLLTSIRAMAADEKMRPHVEAIDRKLQGIEDEVEKGEITPEEGDKKVEKVLKQHQSQVADALAQQRAENLFQLANERASKYLDQLPEYYTDKDKEILGRVWAQEVDWDKIESDSTLMNTELAESLDRVLNWYGEPKGYKPQVQQQEQVVVKPPEEVSRETVQSILDKEWDKLNEDGSPSFSDDEFRKEAASLLRHSRKAGL